MSQRIRIKLKSFDHMLVDKSAAKIVDTVKATGATSYQWYYRTSSTGEWKKCTGADATTASISVEAKSYRDGYQYRCTVSNAAGSVNTSAVTLTVK